jgi:hypothetical protein
LSPIVTAGLPAPGPLPAALELAVVALELLDEELLEDELLPHAAMPTVSANAAEMPHTCLLALLHRLPFMRRLLCVRCR